MSLSPLVITKVTQPARPRSLRLRRAGTVATATATAASATSVSLAGYATTADLSEAISTLTASIGQVETLLGGRIDDAEADIDTLRTRINTVESTVLSRINTVESTLLSRISTVESTLTSRIADVEAALAGYLPLTGGTMTGSVLWTSASTTRTTSVGAGYVQLVGDWASLTLANNAGARIVLSAHASGDRLNVDFFPADSTTAVTDRPVNAGIWHAYTKLSMGEGAVLQQGAATMQYDASTGVWIFNKPIVSHGDVTAFSS